MELIDIKRVNIGFSNCDRYDNAIYIEFNLYKIEDENHKEYKKIEDNNLNTLFMDIIVDYLKNCKKGIIYPIDPITKKCMPGHKYSIVVYKNAESEVLRQIKKFISKHTKLKRIEVIK